MIVTILLWLIALVGLPLLIVQQLLGKDEQEQQEQQEQEEQEEDESLPAWWHAHSMASSDVGDALAAGGAAKGGGEAASKGKLVGGSRPVLKLGECAQCGAADPPVQCGACRSVAYCSRECQRSHWPAAHKAECKKMKKQAAAEARLAAASVRAEQEGSAAPSGGAVPASGGAAEDPAESNSVPPLPKQILYPAEKYAQLAAAPPQRKQPLGLQNVGNTCYANSLLQSLLATPSLAAYLVTGEHSRGCLKPRATDWCVLCELEKLAVQAYSSSGGKVLNPKPLLCNVKRLGKQFSFGRQEDSHELFLRLVEAVEAVQLLEAGGKKAFDLRSRETALIHHVFAGYTRNQVECLGCGHVSRTYECCTSLTLEVGPRVASLEAALARFAAAERLDGDNRYKCDGCKAYMAADKSTRLELAPHHLQVCLKRFTPGRYGKITSKLTYPEQLDLAPYMAEGCLDADPVLYNLYAIVVHIDWGRSTDYGHYIAYVKSEGAWFQCDDSSVTPVAAAKALAAGAYLLFYERQAPRRLELTPSKDVLGKAAPAVAVEEEQAEEGQRAAEEGEEGGAGGAAAPAAEGEAAAGEAGAEAAGADAGAAASAPAQCEQLDAAQAQPQRREQHQGGMPRVETAPASLPHMRSAASPARRQAAAAEAGGSGRSSMDLSQESSQELLLVGGEEAAGAVPVGVSEPFHASASEADLTAARQRRDAADTQHAQRTPQQQEQQQQQPGAEGLQEEAAEAAAAARAEAEALQQRQVHPADDACSAGSDAGDGGSSDASSECRYEPASLNPYQLLGEGSDNCRNSSSSDSSSAASADEDVGGSEQEGSDAAALSQPQVLSARVEHSATAEAQQQEHQGSDVGAGATDMQAPAGGQQAPPANEPTPDDDSAADSGTPAAAAIEAAAAAAAAAPCTPAHESGVSEEAGSGQRTLRLSVKLPGLAAGEAAVEWRVQPGGTGGAPRQLLVLHAQQYALKLPLPVEVAADAGAASWVASEERFTITWPVV